MATQALPEALKAPEVTLKAAASESISNEPQFVLPVDSEHKAKTIKILSFAQPHMRSFWVSSYSSHATLLCIALVTILVYYCVA
jgi:hypothetical protein